MSKSPSDLARQIIATTHHDSWAVPTRWTPTEKRLAQTIDKIVIELESTEDAGDTLLFLAEMLGIEI